ncbi:MAG: hypothetical protein D6709_11395 [Chloroflexi bacterium]|uniref:hypothetical protein n=1 Tax=Candidatus Roseilinea sp. NK_OTU-006 TaxID=2704250 RepID=UPI000F27A7AF|nr:hypothetical protein [Candidatus Roseilinea sp. NK_OTU-006]RMG62520.1 MAG: hypothetical protein D6709_11395 [Chloroflexota bacterium]
MTRTPPGLLLSTSSSPISRAETSFIVDDAIRIGARVVWMQEGIENEFTPSITSCSYIRLLLMHRMTVFRRCVSRAGRTRPG